MSDCEESFFADHTQPKANKMDAKSHKVEIFQDPNSNVEDEICEDENKEADHLEEEEQKEHLYSNQEYADMKGDPTMRYEYSSGRPAAGYSEPHTPRNMEPVFKSRRHYKTADEGFDTGMNTSGASTPRPRSRESTPGHGEGTSYTNSEYANMKGDPEMSYEYSSGRSAAGQHSQIYPHTTEGDPTSRRHYKTADDGSDKGMNKSGASSPGPRSRESTPGHGEGHQISHNIEIHEDDKERSEHQVEPEGVWYTNSEYANMKGDSSMRYEYSSGRAAAGFPSPSIYHTTAPTHISRPHSGLSGCEMDTEIDKSGTSTPEPETEEPVSETAEDVDPEKISYTNSEYAKMKGDPSMRYEYSSGRPAAGCRTPQH